MRQLTKATQDHLGVDAIYKYIHNTSRFKTSVKLLSWAFTGDSMCLFLILSRQVPTQAHALEQAEVFGECCLFFYISIGV